MVWWSLSRLSTAGAAAVASIGHGFEEAIVKCRQRGRCAQAHAVAGHIDSAIDATNGLLRPQHPSGGSRRGAAGSRYPEMQMARLDSGQGTRGKGRAPRMCASGMTPLMLGDRTGPRSIAAGCLARAHTGQPFRHDAPRRKARSGGARRPRWKFLRRTTRLTFKFFPISPYYWIEHDVGTRIIDRLLSMLASGYMSVVLFLRCLQNC